jgi:glutathione synthase/RimK-type ligase-like ATP-grasp enzyme
MKVLFVVNRKSSWPHEIPGSAVTAAQTYLTDKLFDGGPYDQIVNLCPVQRHQGRGYYVSLLAGARGHRPLPDVKTIEDLQSEALMRLLADEIDAVTQRHLRDEAASSLQLEAYFGTDPAGRHASLAQELFALVRVPLIRARFRRSGQRWQLRAIRALAAQDVPSRYKPALLHAATEFVTGHRPTRAAHHPAPARLAILHDSSEPEPPSNAAALGRFLHAAQILGIKAQIINRHAIGSLEQFDALFIRDTTNLAHYTYEFSRRATALGMVVIDDPDSIVRCNNKVYLNELLTRHNIAVPRTMMVHRDNLDQIVPTLGLPCILKQPDSAFSLGVAKVESEEQLGPLVKQLLAKSELIVAQEFLPTEFDWRVGILDRRPLFVCRYYMAPGHWQVIKRESANRVEGRTTAFSVGEVPEIVIRTALKAADLIGAGFYGVDLKQVGDQCYVIEVNDNPNVDAGNEDGVLKDALYREVMGVFYRRIRERARAESP